MTCTVLRRLSVKRGSGLFITSKRHNGLGSRDAYFYEAERFNVLKWLFSECDTVQQSQFKSDTTMA